MCKKMFRDFVCYLQNTKSILSAKDHKYNVPFTTGSLTQQLNSHFLHCWSHLRISLGCLVFESNSNRSPSSCSSTAREFSSTAAASRMRWTAMSSYSLCRSQKWHLWVKHRNEMLAGIQHSTTILFQPIVVIWIQRLRIPPTSNETCIRFYIRFWFARRMENRHSQLDR